MRVILLKTDLLEFAMCSKYGIKSPFHLRWVRVVHEM